MASKISQKVFFIMLRASILILLGSNISILQASIKDNSLLFRLLPKWAFVGFFLLRVSFMDSDVIFSGSLQIAS
jgi:hypothetical protein